MTRPFRLWFLLLLMPAILRLVAAATVPLIDDEAYYWVWARHLDWGYLDQPPMIAYLIALTTWPGDSEVWVRLPALLVGVATTYSLFLLGRELFDERAGWRAALLFQLAPILSGGALFSTPDAPLFLAWTVALRYFWRGVQGSARAWTTAGIITGLGLLSKLPMIFLGAGAALFVLVRARQWLRRPQPFAAALLALVIFTPPIYWNATHGWATVQLILHGRLPGSAPGISGILSILLEQLPFALLLFPAFVWAFVVSVRRRRDPRFGFLLWTAIPIAAFTLAAAWAAGAPHGNWMGPAYLGMCVVLGAIWNRATGALAAVTGAIVAYGFAVALIPALPALPGANELYGWEEATVRLKQELADLDRDTGGGDDPPAPLVVADRYQIAAQVAYHTRETVPVTLLPSPHPASVWPSVGRFRGADAVAVMDARWPPVDWRRYCARVHEAEPLIVHFHGRPLRAFRVFRLFQLNLPAAAPTQ